MKAKRMVSMMLAALMTVSMMACGEKKADPSEKQTAVTNEPVESEKQTGGTSESEKQTEATNEPVDPLGKYEEEITLRGAFQNVNRKYIPGNPDFDSPEKNVWIQAYKDKLGINIKYDWVSNDYDAYTSKWNMAMAQKKLPDFGYVTSTVYSSLLDAGLVMDMTDIFETYASDTYKEWLDADGGTTRAFSTRNGRMMGLPFPGSQPDTVSVFYIRKDWLDKLKLSVPKTTDDLMKTAKAFKENKLGGDDTYGIPAWKYPFQSDYGLKGFFEAYGAYPDAWVAGADNKLIYGSTDEKMKEPLLKLQSMYKDGLINEDFAVSNANVVQEDVAAGKVGIVYGTFWTTGGISDTLKNNSGAEWVCTEIPTADGKPAVVQGTANPSGFLFVNKDCKNPEAIVKMVNLQIELLNNKDPEIVKKYSTTEDPTDKTKTIQTSLYVATSAIAQRPWQNLTRHLETTKAIETKKEDFTLALSKTTYENYQKYLAGDLQQLSTALIFGPTGTFSVINKYKQDNRIIPDQYQAIRTKTMDEKYEMLKEALNAAMVKVIMGEDISTYEQAVKDWYQNGGQTMTDEANAWYQNK